MTEPQEETDRTTSDRGQRRVVLVVVLAVVVLAVAGVVTYLLTSGDDEPDAADRDRTTTSSTRGTPTAEPTPSATSDAPVSSAAPPAAADDVSATTQLAEQVATAITSHDLAAITRLSCDQAATGAEDQFPPDAKAEVAGEPQISGDTATIPLSLSIGASGATTVPMPMEKRDGRWCVP